MVGNACRLAVMACLLGGSSALAQPTVLVLHGEGAPERPGLLGALNVQLAGVGSARAGGELEPGPLAQRVRAASRAAREQDALLSMWVEPDAPHDGEQQFLLYLVGPREGRALFQVMRLPDGADADVDRSLALKVREVFERVEHESTSNALAVGIAPPPPPPGDPGVRRYGASVSVGVLWAPSLTEHEPSMAGLEAAVGAIAMTGQLIFGVGARVVLPAPALVERAGHRIEIVERSYLLDATTHYRVERWQFGGRLGAGIRVQDVAGTTSEETRRSLSLSSAAGRIGPLARYELLGRLAVEAWLGLELSGPPHRFDINDTEVARNGLLRPFAVLSVGVHAP